MNINKDNYEEYFLLFADNELSDQEKNMVEAFVKQHADLEEEFLIIKQSILKPENDLKFEDKSSLFRHTQKIINHTNYQEVFVLYIDNELTGQERDQTEVFLSETPSLKNEFELFEKLKLQPDKTIVFPNKRLLLKREDGGKVVPFKWWKAIAAAALLGAGIWIGIDFQKDDKNDTPATVKINISKKPVKIIPAPADTTNIQVNVVAENKPAKPSLKQKTTVQKTPGKLPVKASDINEFQVLKTQKQTNNLPPVRKNIDKNEKERPDIVANEAQKNTDDIVGKESNDTENAGNKPVKQDEITTAGKTAVPDVRTASYTSDEDENNNNNYAFYNITEEKFNKSKVGGFLRKVKRIIERKISPLNNSKNQREVVVK